MADAAPLKKRGSRPFSSPMKERTSTCCFEAADDRCRLVSDHLESLSAEGVPLSFRDGQVLFYEGHFPFGFFYIKKGQAVFTRETSKGESDPVPTTCNVIGLCHLIGDSKYCATCRAEGDLEVLFFPKKVVMDFLNRHAKK